MPTSLLPVNWDYNLRRSIIGLYYSLQTNSNLSLITVNQPGIKPRSPVPKAAMLLLCKASLMNQHVFVFREAAVNEEGFKDRLKHRLQNFVKWFKTSPKQNKEEVDGTRKKR